MLNVIRVAVVTFDFHTQCHAFLPTLSDRMGTDLWQRNFGSIGRFKQAMFGVSG
jgi:hypothetical protein